MDDITKSNLSIFLERQEQTLQQQFIVLTVSQRRFDSENIVNKGTKKEQEERLAALGEIKLNKDKIVAELRHIGQIKDEIAKGTFKFESR